MATESLGSREPEKRDLKGSGGHKGSTSILGTACDWRPGVARPTDILLLFKRRCVRGHVYVLPFFFFQSNVRA